MANRRRYAQDEPPPADWTPTQAVADPVINSPYEEPTRHWSYQDGQPFQVPGRRPAMYWYRSKKLAVGQADIFAEEQRDELPLVNRLRADVKRWRESGYRGASRVTKELLRHWRRQDAPLPLFFCQLEAAETLIYVMEIAIPGRLRSTGFRKFNVGPQGLDALLAGTMPASWEEASKDFFPRLIDDPGDSRLSLRRLGCKMATGSGKTIVMAMLVAWAFCNRGRNPTSKRYPNGVLVCAPNVTVRKRLRVLKPFGPNNYYDKFDLIPRRYGDLLGSGRITVVNWHRFLPTGAQTDGGKSWRVVDKGDEPADAFTLDRIPDLRDRFPILVLNDEGTPLLASRSGQNRRRPEEGVGDRTDTRREGSP